MNSLDDKDAVGIARIGARVARSPAAARILVLVVPALLVLGLIYFFHGGNRASDDLGYAELAYSILDPAQSKLQEHGHHSSRVGMTAPLAVVFSVFGVSDWSLSLLSILCTVATVVLLARLTQELYGNLAAAMTGGLFALFPPTAYLATWYLPEPIINFELTLASVLFFAAMRRGTGAQLRYYLSGLLIGLAYLTTEVGALLVGVMGLYLIVQRQLRPVHFWILGGFLTVLVGEMLGHTLVHGNPLYRFSIGRYVEDPMLVGQNANLAYRLIKAYPAYFVQFNTSFGAFGPLLLLGGLYGLMRFRSCAYFVIWAASMLVFYNFMPVSIRPYMVLPADSRLIVVACLPLIVLTGVGLADLLRWAGRLQRSMSRSLVGAAAALVLVLAALVTVVALDFDDRYPSKSTLMARNVRLASQAVEQLSPLSVASDARSISLLRFYRQFDPQDSYTELDAIQRALEQSTPVEQPGPALVLLNMPVLFERELTGTRWRAERAADTKGPVITNLMAERCHLVYAANVDDGRPIFDNLFGAGWTAELLQVNRQFDRRPAYTGVKLFQCGAPAAGRTTMPG